MHRPDADADTPLRQSRLNFDQSDVTLLGDQPFDEVGMCFDPARVPVTTARLGNRPAMPKSKALPADCARDAHPEMRCSRSAAHAAVNRGDNPVSKVL